MKMQLGQRTNVPSLKSSSPPAFKGTSLLALAGRIRGACEGRLQEKGTPGTPGKKAPTTSGDLTKL